MKRICKGLILCTTLVVLACSNQNSVDGFLNDYEKFVTKWEKKASKSNLTISDVSKLQKEALKIAAKQEKLFSKIDEGDLTPNQADKLEELSERLSNLTMEPINESLEGYNF